MDFRTTEQHLARAVQLLAVAEGSISDRLRAAHDEALRHMARDAELPEHLRPTFDTLMTALDDLFRQNPVDEYQAKRLAALVVKFYRRLINER